MASSISPGHIQMENDWEYRHGRIDPGPDESIDLVESVPAGRGVQRAETRRNEVDDDSIGGVQTGFRTLTTPHGMLQR